ncbi:MAG: hypothetical protein IJ272_09270 [Clostridia bacterium]|nr:hypothetical protein [Clostridia bacterium]
MITILFTVLLAICLHKRKPVWAWVAVVIGALIVLLLPVQGYNEAELVQQVELLPVILDSDMENAQYVATSEDGLHAYRYVDATTTEDGVVSATSKHRTSVQIVPIEDDETPMLYKYVTTPKRIWFTFALGASKTQYVFYIPSNTPATG